ncbi:hypothetical protein VSU16_02995 [Cetobacterium somerae]|uniref:hypothetical protein n=1 Tax=Cetobacterium somerae TaxID=188913 RepID=UPI002E7AE4D1|nr:hypothetical protein [Cetobacterium somerae]WVJ01708.1 hypothetical protein VSU16_02995 [Cetobacterium somerae]
MEKKYFKFAEEAYKTSSILYENGRYHNSVYFGGYVLEGYLKVLLVLYYSGMTETEIPDLLKHSPNTHLRNLIGISAKKRTKIKVDEYIFIKSEIKKLFEWHPGSRYEIEIWDDEKLSKIIQNEIKILLKKMYKLKSKGIIKI